MSLLFFLKPHYVPPPYGPSTPTWPVSGRKKSYEIKCEYRKPAEAVPIEFKTFAERLCEERERERARRIKRKRRTNAMALLWFMMDED